jgi:hypothetical protein
MPVKQIWKILIFVVEYESILETALAHASVDPWVLFDEKTKTSKISWDCPFDPVCIV